MHDWNFNIKMSSIKIRQSWLCSFSICTRKSRLVSCLIANGRNYFQEQLAIYAKKIVDVETRFYNYIHFWSDLISIIYTIAVLLGLILAVSLWLAVADLIKPSEQALVANQIIFTLPTPTFSKNFLKEWK